MTWHIIIASQAAGLNGERQIRGHIAASPQRAHDGVGAHSILIADRGGASASSEIFRNGRLAIGNRAGRPSNFSRRQGPGSLIPSRVNCVQQPTRGLSVSLNLLRVRVRQHDEQSSMKGFPSERKPEARNAKSAARDGNAL